MNAFIRCCFAGSLLTATAFAASGRIERVVEKTFVVNGAGTLRVETQGGEIRVTPSSDSKVTITARQKIRANSDAEADELLKKLELTLEQSGNDVTAVARYERQPSGFRFGSWPPVNVEFIVSVPAQFATDLRTSGGNVTLGDMAGRASVRTSGGSIRIGKIGAPVDGRTSGGSVFLDEAGGDVDLRTSGGGITVGRVAGAAKLSTSGGSIKIESVVGALEASTSGGGIQAAIAGPLKEDCSLSTSGGSVRVTVDKSAAFQLDASTSGGSVNAEGLTLTLTNAGSGRGRLTGAVNGGGQLLKLRSSGGGITVRAQ